MPVMRTSANSSSAAVACSASLIRRPRSAGPASPWHAPACGRRAFAAQHARDLAPRASPSSADTPLLRGAAFPPLLALGDHQVVVGAGRHLRQVGDGQHLAITAQLLHQRPTVSATAPPTPASTSSKISVCAVPSSLVVTAMASAMRDSSPPEATLPTGRGVLPGWPADQECDFFQARCDRPAAAGLQGHFEAAALHAEPLHRLRDGLRQLRVRPVAQPCSPPSPPSGRPDGGLLAAFERIEVGRGIECLPARPSSRPRARAVRPAALVATCERHPQPHALVQFSQVLRVEHRSWRR
jgi:hypothetical protein